MSIGERLKNLRMQAGYNKKQVADMLSMPYTTYNNYETDAREPGSETLRKLSKLYSVSIDYLLENDYPTKIETIAAHHDGNEWTDEEIAEIEEFMKFVLSKRK